MQRVTLLPAWNGMGKVKQGFVVYVAAERQALTERRMLAFRKEHGVRNVSLLVLGGMIDLTTGLSDADALATVINEASKACGVPCIWIVIDTLTRTFGPGDQHQSKDMAKSFAHAIACQKRQGRTSQAGNDRQYGEDMNAHKSSLRAANDNSAPVLAWPTLERLANRRDLRRVVALRYWRDLMAPPRMAAARISDPDLPDEDPGDPDLYREVRPSITETLTAIGWRVSGKERWHHTRQIVHTFEEDDTTAEHHVVRDGQHETRLGDRYPGRQQPADRSIEIPSS